MTTGEIINSNDYKGIQQALSANPGLANEGIPYDERNTAKAHPLHRIADGFLPASLRMRKPLQWQNYFWNRALISMEVN
jgi:hypothetical protein